MPDDLPGIVEWAETEPGHRRPYVRYRTETGETARFFLDGIGSTPDWREDLDARRADGCAFPDNIEELVQRFATMQREIN